MFSFPITPADKAYFPAFLFSPQNQPKLPNFQKILKNCVMLGKNPGNDYKISPRIVDGEEILCYEAPSVVAVLNKGRKCYGTGTLLSPCWVVTAAHCATHPINIPAYIRVGSEYGDKGGKLYQADKTVHCTIARYYTMTWH